MRAMSPVNTGHGQWSSRIGLLLAAVGSAAGPGDIRKFPYIVAESGGAAFVAVYLIDALRSAFSGMDKDAAVAAFSSCADQPDDVKRAFAELTPGEMADVAVPGATRQDFVADDDHAGGDDLSHDDFP